MLLLVRRGFRFATIPAVLTRVRNPSTFLFTGLMAGNVLAYVYQMFMARMLSPADYGLLVTLTSVSYVLSVVMRTIQAWVIEAIASAGGARTGHALAVFVGIMRTVLLLGAVVMGLDVLGNRWVMTFLQVGTSTPVTLLGLYAATSFLIAVPRGMLLGFDRFYAASFVYAVEPFARLVIGVGLVILGLSMNGALAGFAAGNLAAFALALVPLWPALHRPNDSVGRVGGLAGLDRYAALALGVNVALMTISSVDQIAVKHFFSAEVAGNYAVAFLLGKVISMSTIALGWVIFARSAVMPLDDPGRPRLLVKGLLVTGAIAVILTIGYLVDPVLPVRLLSGSQYLTADTYVGLVGVEMTLFSFVCVQAYYQISVKKMQVVWPLGVASVLEVVLLARYHASAQQVLMTLIAVMSALLLCVSILSWRILRGSGRPSQSTDQRPEDSTGVVVVA